MALILCLETSSINCSVSLFENGKLVAVKEANDSYQHSEKLHPFIQNVLDTSNRSLSDLDAVAVGNGPGSFTGLRIGVAAAKGLCFSLDIPLIACSSMRTMSKMLLVQEQLQGLDLTEYLLCPLIDARRMEVYCGFFDSKLNSITEITAEIIDETTFVQILNSSKIVFFGDGMPKVREVYHEHQAALFVEDILPSSLHMIEEAQEKFKEGIFEDSAYFEPFYLKDFQPTTPKKKV